MPPKKGTIVLMGSGELTATMVEVHKALLAGLGERPKAVFLDTPAGFQLNVDQISQKAVEYFQTRVKHPLAIASFKSHDNCTSFEAEQAFRALREADYVLIGPGSPTYAVRQWLQTSIPDIFTRRVEAGGCLVAASAAALTVGRFTMPVYEIYKVGTELHWADGMNILSRFGFNFVVIPHWNNAEGGTHDTRFCYMGEARFQKLEALLPDDVSILGLDEHTACIIDLEKEEAVIRGLGQVTLRHGGSETILEKGERFPLAVLRGEDVSPRRKQAAAVESAADKESSVQENSFWDMVHALEDSFHAGLEKHEMKEAASALLELDKMIWKAQQDAESPEFISQARDIMRDMIVLMAAGLEESPETREAGLDALVSEFLHLRTSFREKKLWKEADAVRDSLLKAGILVEDTESGARWRLKN
jgi:peptidase E